MTHGTFLISGAQRSGTTLLQRLIDAIPQVSALSQPFPLLFVDAKRQFLRSDDGYPLSHLFLETRYGREDFARHLTHWRADRVALASAFAAMKRYSGQYTRFADREVNDALSTLSDDDDFASAFAALARSLSRKPDSRWFGTKETSCEEFIPPFLDRGIRCALIVRDPRAVIASLNHGRGEEFAGAIKPTLFNLRAWRKSVAVVLAMEHHPAFHWCRYEDLVGDPRREIARIAGTWAEAAATPRAVDTLLKDDGSAWPGNSSHRAMRGIATSSVSAWRDLLSSAAARLVEAACLPELRALAYETTLSRDEAIEILERASDPYPSPRTDLEREQMGGENIRLEIQRLQRVDEAPGAASERWFIFPRAHIRLAEGLRQ